MNVIKTSYFGAQAGRSVKSNLVENMAIDIFELVSATLTTCIGQPFNISYEN